MWWGNWGWGTISSVTFSPLEAPGWSAGEWRLKGRFPREGRSGVSLALQVASLLDLARLIFGIREGVTSGCPFRSLSIPFDPFDPPVLTGQRATQGMMLPVKHRESRYLLPFMNSSA